jgi:hypothetical protein
MLPENPKVFISHASEDKERFVLDFARKLRSKGIDAWVDRWKMLPGDSIVDKIFEEGIAKAQAMVVVVSEYSVNKPWVREELNAGMVRKINGVSRLIPVVIDDLEDSQIPESLKATVWERVKDLDDYVSEFEAIVRSIYGQREKPQLGDPPEYTQMKIDTVPGLSEVDSLVLKLCCEVLVEQGSLDESLRPQTIFERTDELELSQDEVLETLQVLGGGGYFNLNVSGEGILLLIGVTDYGFDKYARTYIPHYDAAFRTVALDLVNHDRNNSREIEGATGLPAALVEHVLRQFNRRGYIGIQTVSDIATIYIDTISPKLKRWLRKT